MPTEPIDVDLDVGDEGALGVRLDDLAPNATPVVTVRASLENWDRVVATLCRLRAAGRSPMLLLRRGEGKVAFDEHAALEVFSWLRLWDQFLVHNFLAVCHDVIPADLRPRLEQEAKLELLWFREYSAALGDPRIHRYPPLPWRRFLRKINDENYAFVSAFLSVAGDGDAAEAREKMRAHLDAFLEAKKRVVSLFPKRWNQTS